jgi:hypothetical protein
MYEVEISKMFLFVSDNMCKFRKFNLWYQNNSSSNSTNFFSYSLYLLTLANLTWAEVVSLL